MRQSQRQKAQVQSNSSQSEKGSKELQRAMLSRAYWIGGLTLKCPWNRTPERFDLSKAARGSELATHFCYHQLLSGHAIEHTKSFEPSASAPHSDAMERQPATAHSDNGEGRVCRVSRLVGRSARACSIKVLAPNIISKHAQQIISDKSSSSRRKKWLVPTTKSRANAIEVCGSL